LIAFAKTLVATLRLSPLMAIALALPALMVVVGLLYAVFAVFGPQGASAPDTPEWHPPAFVAQEAISHPAAANDVQTLTRPIFSKTRRPAPAASGAAAPKQQAAEAVITGLQVAGIAKAAHAKRAFILSPSTPNGDWFAAGETIDAWTITTIGDTELTLKSGSKSATLQLYSNDDKSVNDDKPVDAPPPPPPPPGPVKE
jgi:hypothetical protein